MKQIRHLYLILLLALYGAMGLHAQVSVQIENAPFGMNRFSVLSFRDYISLSPVFLAEKQGAEEQAELTFKIETPTWVRVSVANLSADLLAIPGHSYRFKAINDPQYPYLDRISASDKNDPNWALDSLNIAVNRFLNTNGTRLYSGGLAQQTAAFCDSLHTAFSFQAEPLFQTYLNFRLDELRLLAKVFSDQKYFSIRFAKLPFQPENPDYMYAFSEMYKRRFGQILLKNKMSAAQGLINNFKGCDTLSRFMAQEPFYPLGALGEGAILFGLEELLSDKKYATDAILYLFNNYADSSDFPEVRQVAAALYKKHKLPVPGDAAPEITVENKTGLQSAVPTDYNKPVYLCFFAPQTQVIDSELAALNELKKKLKDQLVLMPVIINSEKPALIKLQTALKLNVELYRNVQFSVLADFRLKNDCTCMVLSPDGTYILPKAPLPSAPDAEQQLVAAAKSVRR